ncbi:MAG: helix-turn-helix domain-containing protein [Clostridia bacterium]|nr:helix-turn-helix domain-containing protein [Clostridia bacterium]
MEKTFMTVKDVMKELSIAESTAYKIMRQLNKELAAKGYITLAGRINRDYFFERLSPSRKED